MGLQGAGKHRDKGDRRQVHRCAWVVTRAQTGGAWSSGFVLGHHRGEVTRPGDAEPLAAVALRHPARGDVVDADQHTLAQPNPRSEALVESAFDRLDPEALTRQVGKRANLRLAQRRAALQGVAVEIGLLRAVAVENPGGSACTLNAQQVEEASVCDRASRDDVELRQLHPWDERKLWQAQDASFRLTEVELGCNGQAPLTSDPRAGDPCDLRASRHRGKRCAEGKMAAESFAR